MAGIDINKVKAEATKELAEEREKAAKLKIKAKLNELEGARKVVKNIERELEDLYEQISEG